MLGKFRALIFLSHCLLAASSAQEIGFTEASVRAEIRTAHEMLVDLQAAHHKFAGPDDHDFLPEAEDLYQRTLTEFTYGQEQSALKTVVAIRSLITAQNLLWQRHWEAARPTAQKVNRSAAMRELQKAQFLLRELRIEIMRRKLNFPLLNRIVTKAAALINKAEYLRKDENWSSVLNFARASIFALEAGSLISTESKRPARANAGE